MKTIRITRKSRRPFRCLTTFALAVALLVGTSVSASAAAPGNDEQTSPKVVGRVPFTDKIDATNATTSPTDPTYSSGNYEYNLCWDGPTVWYAFTPGQDARLVADTFGSDYDTQIAAFKGNPSQDNMVGCNDDWRSQQSRVAFEGKAGTTYTFMVSGPNPGLLVFNLRAAIPPTNDEIGRAKSVNVNLPYKDDVDTTDATLNVNDPSCSGRARSVWYRYSRPESWDQRRVEVSTRGSDYYTSLSVYTGSRNALSQIECDSGGYTSRVRFPVEPGKTYWIMVAAANNSQGGSLNIQVKNMPLPFKWRFNLGNSGRISSVTGATHVGGSLECNKKARVEIYVTLTQQQPTGKVKSVGVRKELACGKERNWGVSLISNDRPFTPGYAGVSVTAEVEGRDRERRDKKIVQLTACERCL